MIALKLNKPHRIVCNLKISEQRTENELELE